MPAVTPVAVIGNTATVAALRAQVGADELAHALLVSGPDRVGKTTLLRDLATTLLDAAAWPGGIDAHPDCWVEDGEGEAIGIRRVRAGGSADGETSLQDFLALRPYMGGRRVAVIGRADRLTEDAANSLLKTIEEPPAGTHILMAAAAPERLPATILSRCRSVTLTSVAASEIVDWLTGTHGCPTDLAAVAAALSLGRPGRARRLATEPGLLAAELDALDGFIAVAGTGVSGALQSAQALAPPAGAEGRERALIQLEVWTLFLRDVVCVASGQPGLVTWTTYGEQVSAWAAALGRERAVGALGAFMKAMADVRGNAQPRLCYDLLFLDLFGGLGGVPVPPVTAPPARVGGYGAAPVGTPKARATTSARPRSSRR